ncbi:prolyl oligopeptidase family serine peptidase [Micromonospora carbonacea]|uniref:prolyl oligopeptidase n=1 Tax=Micromonospora carbonacea TaxID=47853 RepID=A0A7H8XL35_9ACTN|nr:prolyl oligopeptidase family serine peptidase [Micromonospora carbonacea]MBB5825966.1 prolyl oligopeptidase [Micromonospora carbonacea]QLD25555.1 S9 family peptidase [Micromonospora carbonacea]
MRGRYPTAPREETADDVHGVRVPDPYRWLEDDTSPQTQRWVEEQDVLYQQFRATLPDTDRWRAELTARTAHDYRGTPRARGRRLFFEHRAAGADLPVLMVREGDVDRPLVDVSGLDPGGRMVLDAWEPSLEGERLAFQVSRDGTEESLLYVLDVATGRTVDGPVDRIRRSSVGWLPGGESFYYVARLPSGHGPGGGHYHRRVYLHKVGADRDSDILVFGDGQAMTRFFTVGMSPDGRWLVVTATTGTAPDTEVYLADLTASSPERPDLRLVMAGARTRLHLAPGTDPDGSMWLRTDHGAPRRRILSCRPSTPERWRELIPERGDAVLDHFAVLDGPELDRPVAVVGWIRHAAAEITVHDLVDGNQVGAIELPGTGMVSAFSVRPEPGHEMWFSYTDFTTPPRVLRFDARTGLTTPWWTATGGSDVVTTQESYPSADVTVRLFLISRTGRPDRPRPVILTGYGGFGISMAPAYSPQAAAWVEAGGVVAIAGLRGGGEEGEQWHRAGRGNLKQNTFDDFHAAGDHLVARGWTTRSMLGTLGGSNGGLLVAAAVTQRPRAYAAVVCMSPLLDMVRYHLSGLGPSWVPEYGSVDDEDQAQTLLAYSPYHHVTPATAFPPVLLTVSDGDTRVDPAHARKMCAALQHGSTGGQVLFRLDRGVGHGSRALSRTVALQSDCLAFLAANLGLTAP